MPTEERRIVALVIRQVLIRRSRISSLGFPVTTTVRLAKVTVDRDIEPCVVGLLLAELSPSSFSSPVADWIDGKGYYK